MAFSVNAAAALNGAGAFATSRRGNVDRAEIERVRRRLGSRATAAQIAKITGRCETDVRAVLSFEQTALRELSPSPARPEPPAPWTSEDVRRLRTMYVERGLSAEACAAALNRTDEATKAQIKRQGLQRRSKDDRSARDTLFTSLWAAGVSLDDLEARFGIQRSGIQKMVRRLGLSPRSRRRVASVDWTPELDQLVLRDFVTAGYPASVVAQRIPGATKSAVISRAFRQGWTASRGRSASV